IVGLDQAIQWYGILRHRAVRYTATPTAARVIRAGLRSVLANPCSEARHDHRPDAGRKARAEVEQRLAGAAGAVCSTRTRHPGIRARGTHPTGNAQHSVRRISRPEQRHFVGDCRIDSGVKNRRELAALAREGGDELVTWNVNGLVAAGE